MSQLRQAEISRDEALTQLRVLKTNGLSFASDSETTGGFKVEVDSSSALKRQDSTLRVRELETECEKMKTKLSFMADEISQLSSSKQMLSDQVQSLAADLTQSRLDNQSQSLELKGTYRQIEESRKMLVVAEEKIRLLAESQFSVSEKDQVIECFRRKIQDQDAEIRGKDELVEGLRGKIDVIQIEKSNLSFQLESLKNELSKSINQVIDKSLPELSCLDSRSSKST
jgi:chromosome segregation ATPase